MSLPFITKHSDINKAWFQAMFDINKQNQEKVTSVEVNQGRVIGYLSSISFAEVQTVLKGNEDKVNTYHVLVKRQPGADVMKDTGMGINGFKKEVWLYDDLLAKLNDLGGKNEDGQIKMQMKSCKCYYAAEEGDMVTLVLENLVKAGYQPFDVEKFRSGKGLEMDELEIALDALASFHAAGIAYREIQGVDYSTLEIFDDAIVNQAKFENVAGWKSFVNDVAQAAGYVLSLTQEKYGTDHSVYKGLKEIYADVGKNIYMKFYSPYGAKPLLTICHGDAGTHNMMVKYDENGKASDIRLYDWQVLRHTSVANDFQYFMAFATTAGTRKKYEVDAKKFYFSRLVGALENYGLNVGKLGVTFEDFLKDCRTRLPLRLVIEATSSVLINSQDPDMSAKDFDFSKLMKMKIEQVRGTHVDQQLLEAVQELIDVDFFGTNQ